MCRDTRYGQRPLIRKLVANKMKVLMLLGSLLFLIRGSTCTGNESEASGDSSQGFSATCLNSTQMNFSESHSSGSGNSGLTPASGSGDPCRVTDVNECLEGSSMCVNESTCVNTHGNYNCVCPEGYSGDGRQDGDGCTVIVACGICVPSATCTPTNESYICVCPDGFTGDGRWTPVGTGCRDVDECATSLDQCATAALCVNTIGNYSCHCPEGYVGDGQQNGSGCMDVDECSRSHDCLIGTTCMNINGSYSCECPDGFRGDGRWPWLGQGCIDINECNEDPTDCVNNSYCINTMGNYYCSCPPGFTGDGRVNGDGCTDIDECIADRDIGISCIIGATCINTNGSFTCHCPPGYTGDGRWFRSGCNDINECVNGIHDCEANQVCFNTIGSFWCKTSESVQGVNYLEFLNIFDDDDGVPLNRIERTPHYGTVRPIYIDGGIPIGTRIETTAYVNINGVITFGSIWPYWSPTLFPVPSYYWLGRIPSIIAPFWNNIDIQREGSVLYKVYSVGANSKSNKLLDRVSRFVSTKDDRAFNFSGNWMLVVDWNSVPPYPQYSYHYYFYYYYYSFSRYSYYGNYYYHYYRNYYSRLLDFYSKRNTFQAILISNGTNTFSVFSYNCDSLGWTGYWRHASVGYSVQTTEIRGNFDEFVNHPLSLRSSVRNVACQNVGYHVPWSNLVYKVGGSASTIQELRAQCKRAYQKDIELFAEIDIVQDALLPCPCAVRQIWRDRRYRFFKYYYAERQSCYIQRFPSRHRASQLCCYSYKSSIFGALVGTDNAVGSSMLRYHPRQYRTFYEMYDKKFRDICCEAAGLCNLFYARRPPNDCSSYRPPVWTWGRGDPHITTLDGGQYTFNGWGEYILILLNESDFMIQCRTQLVVNSTATQFSGFAFGLQNNSVIQITSTTTGRVEILHNGVDISHNVTNINDTFSDNIVDVTRTETNTILSAFSNGLAVAVSASLHGMLNIIVNLPVEYNSLTQGLMGNFNGNITDDFIFSNGTMLDDGAADSIIHEFGQSWEVSEEQSLFTYPQGLSARDFSHPEHVPTFLDEVVAGADSQIRQRCNNNAQCIFDATQTGDEEIGLTTMQFDMNAIQGQMEATNEPPRVGGPSTFMVTVGSTSQYVFNVSDDNNFNVTVGSTLPQIGHLVQEGDTFTFTWNVTNINEANTTLMFIATDNLGATSFLRPQLLICPCQNSGNCTIEGLSGAADNPLVMNCLCSPAWNGHFCEEDTDGCLLSTCAAEVSCTDIPAPGIGATCGPCPEGYSGDGQDCIDIDECVQSDNGCDQVCVNTIGNFTCECFPNYRLINTTHCEDVDECLLLNGGCHQQCTNTEGSHYCSCYEGYELRDDNSTCEVHPDYACPNGGGCDQMCVRVNGRSSCSCNSGYKLAANGHSCIDMNECETNVCEQLCNNFDGGYSCDCNSGYTLAQDGSSCSDIDECTVAALDQRQICPHSAYCENTPGSYECICPGDTQLINGTCTLISVTAPPTTTTVKPGIDPIPVGLKNIQIIIIITAPIVVVLLIFSLVFIVMRVGKCFKRKSKILKVKPSPSDIELIPVSQ